MTQAKTLQQKQVPVRPPEKEIVMAKAEAPVSLETSENQRSWADLPVDLLCNIFSRIFAGERAIFYSVCKQWNSVPSLVRTQQFQRLEPVNSDCFSPLLMHSKNKLLHPIYGGLYHSDLPNIIGTTIRATRDDWILTIHRVSHEFVFVNSFTKEEVSFPYDEDMSVYYTLYFSSAPTLPDCLIVALGLSFNNCFTFTICYTKIGDSEWTTREISEDEMNGSFVFSYCCPIVCNGLYYFLGIHGDLLIYNPEKDKLYFEEGPKFISVLMTPGDDRYMLESDDNIIAVFVTADGRSLNIFQWNISNKVWETVENLGNRMLFVSRLLSFCVESTSRGTGNKIYFPRSVDDHILFYSLSTKRYHTFVLGTTYEDFYGSKGVPKYVSWIKKPSAPAPILSLVNQSDDKVYAATKLRKRKGLQMEMLLSEKMGERSEVMQVKGHQELIISRPPLLRQPDTWLMILDGDSGKLQTFYSITEDHCYIRHVPELENKYVGVCYEGLLGLMDKCTKEWCILNILTMEKLQLPELSGLREDSFFVLSSLQMDGSCRVIWFDDMFFWSCYLGDNEFVKRKVIYNGDSLFKVINFDGKLFALTNGDNDLVMGDFSDPDFNLTRVIGSNNSALDSCILHLESTLSLVEGCGEILLISFVCNDGEVSDVTIFKADLSNAEWKLVNTIGDVAIFVDERNATSSPASAFGLKGNAVYWKRRRNLYMYDLEDESISMHLAFPIPETNSASRWLSRLSPPYNKDEF